MTLNNLFCADVPLRNYSLILNINRKCYSALPTSMIPILHDFHYLELRKQKS